MDSSDQEFPMARKPHRCNGCRGVIEPKMRYITVTCFDGGDVWAVRLCPKCWYVWHNWIEEDWGEGDLVNDHPHLPDDYQQQFDEAAAKWVQRRKEYLQSKRVENANGTD